MSRKEDIQSKYSEMRYGEKVGVLTFLGALLTMFTFLITNYFTLPLGDMARQSNVICAIFDPFVLTVALPITALAAALAFPFAYFCLKERNVFNCSLFISSISVVSVVTLTLNEIFIFKAIPIILVILFACLLLCKFLPVSFFRESTIIKKNNESSDKFKDNEGNGH